MRKSQRAAAPRREYPHRLGQGNTPPSPGTPGEGRGEGLSQTEGDARFRAGPHPNPLPEYRERGPERPAKICVDVAGGTVGLIALLVYLLLVPRLSGAAPTTAPSPHRVPDGYVIEQVAGEAQGVRFPMFAAFDDR